MKRKSKMKPRQKVKRGGGKEYDNTNRGVLFKNDRKKGDNDPDYTGTINFDGLDCYLNAWLPDADKKGPGKPVLRLSVKEKGDRAEPARAAPQKAPAAKAAAQDFDDEIPF